MLHAQVTERCQKTKTDLLILSFQDIVVNIVFVIYMFSFVFWTKLSTKAWNTAVFDYKAFYCQISNKSGHLFFWPVHVSTLSPSPVDYQSNRRQTILSLACLQLGFNFQGTICTPAKVYLFNALSISMVTRTDRAIVIGCGSLKTLQSRPGKFLGSAGHCIWWVYQENTITCTYYQQWQWFYSCTK